MFSQDDSQTMATAIYVAQTLCLFIRSLKVGFEIWREVRSPSSLLILLDRSSRKGYIFFLFPFVLITLANIPREFILYHILNLEA